eukprot:TRINITY_DN1787_c0_g1_i1.p1 TRINITY_DN1787_c0_g1~~TRINITY_DN1787_c0_g1_i1.p1  ORF type:complete len:693 (+),score=117.08 TRINITY_DN1787_c0_g1_i1:284-2362(+)
MLEILLLQYNYRADSKFLICEIDGENYRYVYEVNDILEYQKRDYYILDGPIIAISDSQDQLFAIHKMSGDWDNYLIDLPDSCKTLNVIHISGSVFPEIIYAYENDKMEEDNNIVYSEDNFYRTVNSTGILTSQVLNNLDARNISNIMESLIPNKLSTKIAAIDFTGNDRTRILNCVPNCYLPLIYFITFVSPEICVCLSTNGIFLVFETGVFKSQVILPKNSSLATGIKVLKKGYGAIIYIVEYENHILLIDPITKSVISKYNNIENVIVSDIIRNGSSQLLLTVQNVESLSQFKKKQLFPYFILTNLDFTYTNIPEKVQKNFMKCDQNINNEIDVDSIDNVIYSLQQKLLTSKVNLKKMETSGKDILIDKSIQQFRNLAPNTYKKYITSIEEIKFEFEQERNEPMDMEDYYIVHSVDYILENLDFRIYATIENISNASIQAIALLISSNNLDIKTENSSILIEPGKSHSFVSQSKLKNFVFEPFNISISMEWLPMKDDHEMFVLKKKETYIDYISTVRIKPIDFVHKQKQVFDHNYYPHSIHLLLGCTGYKSLSFISKILCENLDIRYSKKTNSEEQILGNEFISIHIRLAIDHISFIVNAIDLNYLGLYARIIQQILPSYIPIELNPFNETFINILKCASISINNRNEILMMIENFNITGEKKLASDIRNYFSENLILNDHLFSLIQDLI